MKKTIFMTGGGGAGTIAASKFLKATNRYKIVLGDMDKWAAGLNFADKSYILPPGDNSNFLDKVSAIIKKEKVDVFVPLVDIELLKTYELKDLFPDLKILLPQYSFTKTVLDKWLMIKEFQRNGLPCPRSFLYKSLPTVLRHPLIVKPRVGSGSRKVAEVMSRKHLNAYKICTCLPPEKILVQERIIGKEFTVSVVVNSRGEVLAVVPKEVVQKRGIAIVAVTRDNREIQKICVDIQHKLKANGPFNVQLILTKDGVPKVFEINPRYSTTIALTMAAGINEIDLLVNDVRSSGKLLPFKKNLIMKRFYDHMLFEEN